MLKVHYDILGVDKNSTKREVIKAYYEKSKQFHPDKGGSDEMMGFLNEAKDAILKHLHDNEAASPEEQQDADKDIIEKVNKVLSGTIFEGLDDPEKRIAKKYAAQHIDLVKKYGKENNVESISGIEFFTPFATNFYYDISTDGDKVNIFECEDLFDLIRNKEASKQECDTIDDSLLQVLTPKIAIEYLVKFIEGRCFGESLKKVQEAFKKRLINCSDVSERSLYAGILEVISIKKIIPGKEGHLLLSLNQITDFIRAKTENIAAPMPDYLAKLLQNLYFRTLFTQATHLFWLEHSHNFNATDRADLINISTTKKYFLRLARQVVAQQSNMQDADLINSTALLKRLYEFEGFSLLGVNQDNSANWCRQRAYETLNWLSRLLPYASRSIIANILIQAGTYFQEASVSVKQNNKFVAKADQKLAFQAYMEAYSIANRSAPDFEIYTLTSILKFIAAFRYQDEEIVEVVRALQQRLLTLLDIFPVYAGLQANISLVTPQDASNLAVMRGLLHALVEMSNNKEQIDHERITVLYQAYEASVKSWYKQNYDPELENRFRLELMELLLKNNNWNYSHLNQTLEHSSMIRHDNNHWLDVKQPLRVMDLNVQTYHAINGVELNTKTGEIQFMLDDGRCQLGPHKKPNTFTIYDLMEMLEKNIMGGSFSLDPVDPQMMYHPFNAMRFAPSDIYQTQFLSTMLLADYLLKFLTVGTEVQGKYPYDMRSIASMIDNLPKHLKAIIDNFHASQRHNSGSIHRFWIEAEQISQATQEDDSGVSKFAMTDLKMVVKKHTMERDSHGNLVDTQKDLEGWDVYVLSPIQINAIREGKAGIVGPAMIISPYYDKVYFVETDHIFKEGNLPARYADAIKALDNYERDPSGKVKTTVNNAMFMYRLVLGLTTVFDVFNHFSPEYVFAQEFTRHYDEFSEHFPILARLKELSKMTLAVRFLNTKQAEAIQKREYYSRLLQALPDWEQQNLHPSKHPSYFEKPNANSSIDEEEMASATFRYENAEKIRALLPDALYKKHLASTVDLAESLRKIRPSQNGQIRKELHKIFTSALPSLSETKIDVLINKAISGNFSSLAEELAKKELSDAKAQIKNLLLEQTKVIDSLKEIGLGRAENKERNLDGKCLWVPASVNHHIKNKNMFFIYGGVRVMPKVNALNSSDPRFSKTINNAFDNAGKATINASNITKANIALQRPANNRSGIPNATQQSSNKGGVHARIPKSAPTSVKGTGGEAALYKTMIRAGYEPQACKINGDQGFDGVFVKRAANGEVAHIVIAEAKYAHDGELRLGTTNNKGKQMSPTWVDVTLKDMLRSSDPQAQATAKLIIQNESKVVYRACVLDPDGKNRWKDATEKVQERMSKLRKTS